MLISFDKKQNKFISTKLSAKEYNKLNFEINMVDILDQILEIILRKVVKYLNK